MPDGRREVAINMLQEWAHAAHAADWWSNYVIQRGNKPLSPVKLEELNGVVAVLQDEADSLREEILQLMGVDDEQSPAYELDTTEIPPGTYEAKVVGVEGNVVKLQVNTDSVDHGIVDPESD